MLYFFSFFKVSKFTHQQLVPLLAEQQSLILNLTSKINDLTRVVEILVDQRNGNEEGKFQAHKPLKTLPSIYELKPNLFSSKDVSSTNN